MKIKLKLTSDELRLIHEKTNPVTALVFNQLSKDKKVSYSIMLDVADKIAPKASTLHRQLSITDGKKKHDLSFKWHEAVALHQFLISIETQGFDHFSQTMLRKVINQLDQKLA